MEVARNVTVEKTDAVTRVEELEKPENVGTTLLDSIPDVDSDTDDVILTLDDGHSVEDDEKEPILEVALKDGGFEIDISELGEALMDGECVVDVLGKLDRVANALQDRFVENEPLMLEDPLMDGEKRPDILGEPVIDRLTLGVGENKIDGVETSVVGIAELLAENVTDGEEDMEPLYVCVAGKESDTDGDMLRELEEDCTILMVLFPDDEKVTDGDPLSLDETLMDGEMWPDTLTEPVVDRLTLGVGENKIDGVETSVKEAATENETTLLDDRHSVGEGE